MTRGGAATDAGAELRGMASAAVVDEAYRGHYREGMKTRGF